MSDEKKVGGNHPPPVETRFKPGQSGNPGGKPHGARNKITAAFLNALAEDFEEHGKKAIQDARQEDPVGYMKVCAGLLPKQIEQTSPLDDVTDPELIAAIAFLKTRLSDNAEQPATH
jgi:hypothetical protein